MRYHFSPMRGVQSRPLGLPCKLPLAFCAGVFDAYISFDSSPRGGYGHGLEVINPDHFRKFPRSHIVTLRNSAVPSSPEETVLSKDQRHQLLSGRFPTDYSGELIKIKTAREEYEKLFHAFNQTNPRFVFP